MINFTKKQPVHSINTPKTGIKLCILFGLLSILICQPCLANPIAMDFEDMIWGPGRTASDIPRILLTDLLIDLAVLIVGYTLIRKIRCLKSIRFFPYLILVVLGGLAIDEFAIIFRDILYWSPLAMFVLTFLLLAAFNYFLCSVFYRLPYKKAAVIAILMGLLTHPDFYSAYSWMPIVWVLLFLLCCAYMQEPHHAKKVPMTSQQASPAVSSAKAARQNKHPKPEIGFPE